VPVGLKDYTTDRCGSRIVFSSRNPIIQLDYSNIVALVFYNLVVHYCSIHMTIPAGNIYCPSCQEVCHDHPSICTVCGTTLTSPPAHQATQQQSRPYSLVPEELVEDVRQNARHLSHLLRHVQQSVVDTQQAQLLKPRFQQR
jgi:predicted amidophosphoribosyltransferase